jgi:hypothetical protein
LMAYRTVSKTFGDRRVKNLGRCRDMGRSPPSGRFFRFYVDFPIQQVPLVLAF